MRDTVEQFVRVLDLEGQAVLRCGERIRQDPKRAEAIAKAIDLLQGCLDRGGKIIVTGVGKSGKVGQKIAATLSSTGSFAVFLHPTEGIHGDLGVVQPNDAVLALSYTGNTEELARLLPSLKSLRVPVIGLGGNSQSKLGQQCDVWMDGHVEQEACPHNLVPTSSTTLALALGDAIAITLMERRGFDAKSFAQNHPGGSLGNRLKMKLADLMHTDLPVLGPEASMGEVVVVMTRFMLGAVIITEGAAAQGRMLGIITDGDLRRALRHQEKFFSLKSSDVMTRQPVSASPGMLAAAALELMENRPSQISELPVVDDEGNIKGLVRLHDLVRAF
ncbi:MAG: KpsF/GutQ family sugar-phosphate isomerase [Oligoflexia bacterium]|nr:KpsF/GutQ family sugar-phosphate isomerase [Oligoflexia bacterium]